MQCSLNVFHHLSKIPLTWHMWPYLCDYVGPTSSLTTVLTFEWFIHAHQYLKNILCPYNLQKHILFSYTSQQRKMMITTSVSYQLQFSVLHCQSLLILLFKEIGRTLYSLSTNNFYYYVLTLILIMIHFCSCPTRKPNHNAKPVSNFNPVPHQKCFAMQH